MKKIVIITGSVIAVIALAIVLFSCSKDRTALNKPVLKNSDTCLIKVAYINTNGEAIFDINTASLSSSFENGMTISYQNDYPGSEYEVDSMAFLKYFNAIEDTLSADSAHYYLILFGRLTVADTNAFSESSSIELIRVVDNLYINRCDDQGDVFGVTITHKCIPHNCSSCAFTYAWSWFIFHGKITGCDCKSPSQPGGYCDHEATHSVQIGFL